MNKVKIPSLPSNLSGEGEGPRVQRGTGQIISLGNYLYIDSGKLVEHVLTKIKTKGDNGWGRVLLIVS